MKCDNCNGTGQTTVWKTRTIVDTYADNRCPAGNYRDISESHDVECTKCGGTGYYHYVSVEHWCSACNGTGETQISTPIYKTYPTGRQLPTGEYTYSTVRCGKCNGSGRETIQESRSGKGQEDRECFITTAVCQELNFKNTDEILNKFRKFRDDWLINEPNGRVLVSLYYIESPKILSNIKDNDRFYILKEVWEKYLKECERLIDNNKNDLALTTYKEMIIFLKNKVG